MNRGFAIAAHGVGKQYLRRSDPARTWRELLTGRGLRGTSEQFWALRDVTFVVEPGSMLGVVGANGAGKSTLLRLLAGIGRPDEGRLEISDRVNGLFELGGAFLGDLTGRENALLAAVVAGFTRAEARAQMDPIVDFAELAHVIDAPLRTYSTGMMMRLAFSVAVHTEPSVLLVDEFLSVGDLAFQSKCLAKIRTLKDGGTAVVLVSHGMDQVRLLCDRALWLRDGRVVALEAAEVVAGAYEAEMLAETVRRTPDRPPVDLGAGRELRINENRFGSQDVEIERVELVSGSRLASGGALDIAIHWRAETAVPAPIFSVTIRREDGVICVDTNTRVSLVEVPDLAGQGSVRVRIERLDLGAGQYFVDVGVFEQHWRHAYDYHWHVYPLVVEGRTALKGVLVPASRWTIG